MESEEGDKKQKKKETEKKQNGKVKRQITVIEEDRRALAHRNQTTRIGELMWTHTKSSQTRHTHTVKPIERARPFGPGKRRPKSEGREGKNRTDALGMMHTQLDRHR